MILILNVVVRVGWSLSIDESREMEGKKEKEESGEESGVHCVARQKQSQAGFWAARRSIGKLEKSSITKNEKIEQKWAEAFCQGFPILLVKKKLEKLESVKN